MQSLLFFSPPLFLLAFSFSPFLFNSFDSLLWFWSFSSTWNLPFDAFSLKWRQISLAWISKNGLDRDVSGVPAISKWRTPFQAIWHQCYSFGRIYVIEWWRVGRNKARLGPEEDTLARGGPPLRKDRNSGQHLAEYLKTSLEKAQNIRHCSENFHRGLGVLVGLIVKLWANLPWGGKGSPCQSLAGEGATKAWCGPLVSGESVHWSCVCFCRLANESIPLTHLLSCGGWLQVRVSDVALNSLL